MPETAGTVDRSIVETASAPERASALDLEPENVVSKEDGDGIKFNIGEKAVATGNTWKGDGGDGNIVRLSHRSSVRVPP